MSRYANTTTVSVSKSKAEIEDILHRYGASGFMSGWLDDKAMIADVESPRERKANGQ